MLNEKGQVILILIVIMTVALAIGLSVVQKSLVDVSTASKVEQSSRAFSAAEAGIEKAISSERSQDAFDLDNNSKIDSVNMREVPEAGQALEYPPLAKEEVAQVWLADPASNLPNCNAGKICYNQTTLDVYWGNSPTDKAAIELTLVYYDGVKYASRKWYLDSGPRVDTNGFDGVPCTGYSIGSNPYQCYKRLENLPTSGLMLIRARLLYNSTSQAFAVKPTSGSLPPQARLFASTGSSGETQRKIQVFQLYKVAPPYFDYGIFSASEINK